MTSKVHFTSAMEDFHRARRQASVRAVLSRFTGRKDDLLPYDEVRKALGATEGSGRKLKDIPIEAIKGSVNRYTDFTSNFLPRKSVEAQRWARVKASGLSLTGLPPIEVYQIGDIFFVLDGNHRVSIARQVGSTHIQAYVKEVYSRIHLTEDFKPDDLIIKTEHLDFLRNTNFDRFFPQTHLVITAPGRYPIIQQQIEAIHFALETKRNGKVPFDEAVVYWHNKVYMPIIEVLRERDLIEEFPSRSETDLYIWILKYQAELTKEYGWDISPGTSAKILTNRFGQQSKYMKTKIRSLYQNWLFGPTTGEWREDRISTHQGRLFADILVVLTGSPNDNYVIDFSLYISQLEGSRLFGLYISQPNKGETDYRIVKYQEDFKQKCAGANIDGELAITFANNPETQILRRTAFANLVVFPLDNSRRQKLNFSKLIHKCPTPFLAVNGEVNLPLKKSLIAFNGSPKSKEALFLGAYLSKFWEISPVILSSSVDNDVIDTSLFDAYNYMEKYNINADYIKSEGSLGIATNIFATEDRCDIIIMSGYNSNTIKKMLSGSNIDEVLFKSKKPILICN